MISDSVPWREDLQRTADRLRFRLTQQRWTERTSYLVERDLLVGFYALRRLMESEKTSTRLTRQRVRVRVFPLRDAEPHKANRWSPWENYDIESNSRGELDVRSLLHEFIHSFILMLAFDENDQFAGVYVASDRTKRHRLYEVPILPVIELFEYVASEDIVFSAWRDGGLNVRLSQHDMVDAGVATYDDDTRLWATALPDGDFSRLSALPGLTPAEFDFFAAMYPTMPHGSNWPL